MTQIQAIAPKEREGEGRERERGVHIGEGLIIQYVCGPMDAGLKEFYISLLLFSHMFWLCLIYHLAKHSFM
jgi:hypothetical protein